MSFEDPTTRSPVHLEDHPGYLIFEEKKKEMLSHEDIVLYNDKINSCRLKMFPGEAPYKPSKTVSADGKSTSGNNITDKNTGMQLTTEEKAGEKDAQESFIFDGKLIGEQKMMSPCKCGHFTVNKYQITGKRTGTSFICAKCNTERYFLPLKEKAE